MKELQELVKGKIKTVSTVLTFTLLEGAIQNQYFTVDCALSITTMYELKTWHNGEFVIH